MLVSPEVLASRAASLSDDYDPQETAEWLDSMEAVVKHGGPDRAKFLLESLIAQLGAVAGTVHVQRGEDLHLTAAHNIPPKVIAIVAHVRFCSACGRRRFSSGVSCVRSERMSSAERRCGATV